MRGTAVALVIAAVGALAILAAGAIVGGGGGEGEPAADVGATTAGTTGDTQNATDAAGGADRVASAGTVTASPASGAARNVYHQSTPTPRSRSAPGSPGATLRRRPPARRQSRRSTAARRPAAMDTARL